MTSSGIAYRRQPLAPRTSVTGSSPLLPTPLARAKSGSSTWKGNRQGGLILDEAISRLLLTPRANIAKQGLPREKHWGELRAEVMQLLPTPTATEYGHNQSPSAGAAVRPSLPNLMRLLPPPHGMLKEGQARRPGPSGNELGRALGSVSSGVSTAQPSEGGKRSTDLRLSPWFVEWMIGLPQGWSDPDCPLSATEFKSNSASSSGDI
jgi:hypothetical protein